MTDLATFAMGAHGGLDRWRNLKTVSAHLLQGGVLWPLKGQDGVLHDVHITVDLRKEWASHRPFGQPNRHTSFQPDRVAIETSNGWTVGQRVGVGFFGGEDGVCEPCRRGDIVNCQNPVVPGVTVDGGYAEVMIAEARGIAAIPDELGSVEAAPLLCAGITTYNALRNAGLGGGDLVAVQGIGGLGHLGIQFARQMGFRTVAIGRGLEKEHLAKELGAHGYIDTAVEDAGSVLQRMGGARAILATAPSGDAMGPLVSGLATRGKLIVIAVPQDHIQLNAFPLVFGGRSIYGSLAGTAIDTEDTLAFSVQENIRPMIETRPLEQAADAHTRMMEGKARFRMVLTMNG